jgi:hypothetical protein
MLFSLLGTFSLCMFRMQFIHFPCIEHIETLIDLGFKTDIVIYFFLIISFIRGLFLEWENFE